MRNSSKLVIGTAVAVGMSVVVVGASGAWSVSNRKIANPTEASAPISPHEIMVKTGNVLPTEYWSHPF